MDDLMNYLLILMAEVLPKFYSYNITDFAQGSGISVRIQMKGSATTKC